MQAPNCGQPLTSAGFASRHGCHQSRSRPFRYWLAFARVGGGPAQAYWPGQSYGASEVPAHPAESTMSGQLGQLLKSFPKSGSIGPVLPFVSLKTSLTTPPLAWIAPMHACVDTGGL